MKNLYLIILMISGVTFGQLQWKPLPTAIANPGNQRFDDVFFINDDVGWAANGYYASVSKTTDGGATWTVQMSNATMGTNYYFRNIEFLDENIGFIGTLDGVFFKTTNGGTTWNIVTNISPNPLAICGLDAVGTSTIYGCGAYFSPAFIIKSTDSGTTWQHIDMSAYADGLVEVLFLDENLGYAAGIGVNGAIVLKTLDGGTTWSEVYNSGISGEYVWKLQTVAGNNNDVFGSVESVTGNSGKLIKSFDAGATWTSKNFPDIDVQAIGFISSTHGWMGGHHTGFFETLDGGDTWINTGIGSNLNRIFILNDNLAYASGTTIYKFSDSNLSVNNFTEISRKALKVIVAPNPINDKLSLSIDFLGNDHLILGLYDNSGKLIKILQKDAISGQLTKSYSFDFPYQNGIYYLNLHTNTGRSSVKIIKK